MLPPDSWALRLAYGDRAATNNDQAREWTTVAFGLPGGQLLVWIAAASVTGYGGYQLYRAYAPKLGRQLDLSQMREPARGWVVGVSRFGIARWYRPMAVRGGGVGAGGLRRL